VAADFAAVPGFGRTMAPRAATALVLSNEVFTDWEHFSSFLVRSGVVFKSPLLSTTHTQYFTFDR
jgi:hypothetical protein